MKNDYQYITDTITQIFGSGAQVFLFGSRAKGKSRKFSDVDIAIDTGNKITSQQMLKIKNILEESSYPYRVDIIDLNNISDEFKASMQNNLVKLTESKI